MRTIFFALAILSLLTVALAAWCFVGASVVRDQYIHISGVCRVGQDSIECWKPDGSPDKADSEFATAYFVANPDKKMQVAFRRRTRLVVTREIIAESWTMPNKGIVDSGGRTLDLVNYGGSSGRGQEAVKLFWYYPEDGISSVRFSLAGAVDLGAAPKLELKPGASADFPGFKATVKSVGKIDLKHDGSCRSYQPPTGPEWRIVLSLDPAAPAGGPIGFFAVPFEFDEKQVVSVDSGANPVEPDPGEFLLGIISLEGTKASTVRLRSRVRPDRVKYVVLTATKTQTVALGEVRLEPSLSRGLN